MLYARCADYPICINMKKNKKPKITVITCCIVLLMVVASHAEVIFKKDGSLVKGVITRDAAKYIIIRKEDGSSEKVLRSDIMRILYTKLYMGKVFVRLTSGDVLEVYKVEEDSETYTFRKDLYKPEEFKVERDRVMFIARSNPTDLSAEAEETEIDLKWSPPFRPPKSYKIYLSGPDLDYRVVAETGNAEYEIENLKSNTTYRVKVTAVDHEGIESLPTDEVELTTKNIPPSRPDNVREINENKSTKKIIWDQSEDIDGKVIGYRVYTETDGVKQLANETYDNYYKMKTDDVHEKILVTAFDDRGDESGYGSIRIIPIGLNLCVSPGILFPLGKLGNLTGMGYGGIFTVVKSDFIISGFEFGGSAGFYFLEGKKNINTDIKSTDGAYYVPLVINAGYRIHILDNLSLIPTISGGVVYIDMSYIEDDKSTIYEEQKQLKTVGPVAGVGIKMDYFLSKRFKIGFFWDQGVLVKQDVLDYPLTRLEISFGMRL